MPSAYIKWLFLRSAYVHADTEIVQPPTPPQFSNCCGDKTFNAQFSICCGYNLKITKLNKIENIVNLLS